MARSHADISNLEDMGMQTLSMVTENVQKEVADKTLELQEQDRVSQQQIQRLPEDKRPKEYHAKSMAVKVMPGPDEPHQPSLIHRWRAKDYNTSKLHPTVKKNMEDGMQWVKGRFLSIEDNKKIKNPVCFEITRWGITEQHTMIHNMDFVVRKFVADHLNSLEYMVLDDEIKPVSSDKRFGVQAQNLCQGVSGMYPRFSFNYTHLEGNKIFAVEQPKPAVLVGI